MRVVNSEVFYPGLNERGSSAVGDVLSKASYLHESTYEEAVPTVWATGEIPGCLFVLGVALSPEGRRVQWYTTSAVDARSFEPPSPARWKAVCQHVLTRIISLVTKDEAAAALLALFETVAGDVRAGDWDAKDSESRPTLASVTMLRRSTRALGVRTGARRVMTGSAGTMGKVVAELTARVQQPRSQHRHDAADAKWNREGWWDAFVAGKAWARAARYPAGAEHVAKLQGARVVEYGAQDGEVRFVLTEKGGSRYLGMRWMELCYPDRPPGPGECASPRAL
mmetsp:Transcript_24927/g.62330  ORF Transcript_24927/g.62330 Transcript_24927/m.62330 type:complete len:281 (-) Transcript_24927:834-1676(-)